MKPKCFCYFLFLMQKPKKQRDDPELTDAKKSYFLSVIIRRSTSRYLFCSCSLSFSLWQIFKDIKGWMAWNFPQLNENKFILVLLFGHGFCYTNHQKLQLSAYLTHFVKNLGVISDSALKSDNQVKSIVNCSFFQLWIMSSVPGFIIATPFEKWNSPPFWIRSSINCLKSQL